MKTEYRNVTVTGDEIRGQYRWPDSGRDDWTNFSSEKKLFRIKEAISISEEAFERIWATQDGYGVPGFWPEQGYDWSGIRDSSDEAIELMDEIARMYVDDFRLARILGVNHL